MTDSLSRPLSISFAAHLGLLALFMLKMTFFPTQPIEIKRSIRVDLVGMPDKVQEVKPAPVAETPKVEVKEAAPPPEKTSPKEVVKEAPKVAPKKPDQKKIKNSQDSAMNRLKAMQAMEKIKQESAAEAAAAQKVIKGNEASKGNSLTGLEQIDYDRYFDQVEQLLYSHWALPEWLASADLRAQALVLVDSSGHVTSKKITKSSGNPAFDAEVISAIEKASPFPPPPARLQGVLAQQGFVFNFPD